MFMPYASDFLVDIATDTIDGASFVSDVLDQYLSSIALHGMAEYTGDSDYGTATLIELDDEDRVVLTILSGMVTERDPSSKWYGVPEPGEWADDAAVIIWGSSYKWWGDAEFFAHIEVARTKYAEFEQEYFDGLPCEDCGSEDRASCTCGDEPETPEHPFLTEVKDAELWGEAFGPAE